MKLKKITAIVRSEALERVENRLKEAGAPGISVTRVKGFGEYANFFTPSWLSDNARIEIFTDSTRVQSFVDAICSAAQTGTAGDGIVVVLPVDSICQIRDRQVHCTES